MSIRRRAVARSWAGDKKGLNIRNRYRIHKPHTQLDDTPSHPHTEKRRNLRKETKT